MNRQSRPNRPAGSLARTIYSVALLIAAGGLIQNFAIYNSGDASVFILGLLLYIVFFALFAVQLVALISGRAVSRITKLTVNLLSGFFLVPGLWVLLGVLADLSGASCVGFFGVSESCTSQQLFIVSFLALHPIVIVPISILGILGLWWGRRVGQQTGVGSGTPK